jgi:hypothetical protein
MFFYNIKITIIETACNFEVIPDKFNVDKACIEVLSSDPK